MKGTHGGVEKTGGTQENYIAGSRIEGDSMSALAIVTAVKLSLSTQVHEGNQINCS